MTPERWRQVTGVFHAALTRDASARPSYLDQACAGDRPLREEVDAMLAVHVEGAPVPEIPVDASLTHTPRLASGTMIGPYRVADLIGAGGMGEVYRARDTKLGRDVAIKVLPAAFTSNAERVVRFEREARLLAALNHPHIAAIYGFEEADGVRALILELVEGDTLADRLDRGPIPLDQALPIARQIAEALDAAHEKGIIHRDLKPANIKITPDGTVKVLDFGLAKAWSGERAAPDLAEWPTVTATAVREGVVMGTPAYMSPEQAHGTAVDKRADIWAFGCVLYEILTGRPAFADDDVSGTLARVLMNEPDWNALPPTTPSALRRLLRRCLAKDRRQRLSDAADARLEIDEAHTLPAGEPVTGAVPDRHATWRRMAIVSLAAALIVGVSVGTTVWLTIRPAPPPVSRLLVPLGAGERFLFGGRHLVALSPDGRHVVYQANQGLYLRPLDQLQATFIAGTEEGGGRSPFFSSDGRSIGFWADGQLKRIGLSGGAPVTLCSADNPWGVSWEANGTILFGQGPKGIWKVPETGGTPEVLIAVESGTEAHGPQLLAGEWVLFTLRPKGVSSWDAAQIVAQSLQTGERRVLIERGRDARYVATGHLLYAVEGVLLAVPFDLGAMRVAGGAVSLIEGIADAESLTGAVHFSVARDGSLVYAPAVLGTVPQLMLVWIDRQGREEPINAPPNAYLYPRISPDGTRVALDIMSLNRDIWIWDFARQTPTRFTFDAAFDWYPVWTPDGRRLLWGSERAGPNNLYWQAADGTGAVERLTESSNVQAPYGFSPDGTRLLLREEAPDLGETLALLTLNGDRRVTPLMRTAFKVRNGEISPDGRWLAYESDESGREEIYVRPFPEVEGGRWQVSTAGGIRPAWARNTRELFYQTPDGAVFGVSVEVESGGFRPGSPTKLVEGRYSMGGPNSSGRTYDVSPDGQRFLMIKEGPAVAAGTSQHLVVVQNWTEELKRRVPRN